MATKIPIPIFEFLGQFTSKYTQYFSKKSIANMETTHKTHADSTPLTLRASPE